MHMYIYTFVIFLLVAEFYLVGEVKLQDWSSLLYRCLKYSIYYLVTLYLSSGSSAFGLRTSTKLLLYLVDRVPNKMEKRMQRNRMEKKEAKRRLS